MRPVFNRRRFGVAALGAGLAALQRTATARTPSSLEGCKRNLRIIDEAVRAYRRQNAGAYPETLWELHQKRFISDQRTFVCPDAAATGDFRLGLPFKDTSDIDPMPSYNYELTRKRIGARFETENMQTERDLKFLAAKTPVGRHIPIVRCFRHLPDTGKVLNLRMNGAVDEGHEYWESDVCHLFPHSYLTPIFLPRSQAPIPQQAPPRPRIQYPESLLDLSQSYNALLDDCWWFAVGPHNLGKLVEKNPRHEPVELAGIQFDVRGVIQLDAKPVENPREGFTCPMFPRSVEEIAVNRSAGFLNVLHANLFAEDRDRKVASLVLNYSDGSFKKVDLRFGENTACWRSHHSDIVPGSDDTAIAWEIDDPRDPSGKLRLFKTRIRLRENAVLRSIDFHSVMSKAAPFIVAMTTEAP